MVQEGEPGRQIWVTRRRSRRFCLEASFLQFFFLIRFLIKILLLLCSLIIFDIADIVGHLFFLYGLLPVSLPTACHARVRCGHAVAFYLFSTTIHVRMLLTFCYFTSSTKTILRSFCPRRTSGNPRPASHVQINIYILQNRPKWA